MNYREYCEKNILTIKCPHCNKLVEIDKNDVDEYGWVDCTFCLHDFKIHIIEPLKIGAEYNDQNR